VLEGWTGARWGWRTRVSVESALSRDRQLSLPGRCRFEVRGSARPEGLPVPGTSVEALVSLRGNARSPLLVASSPRLLEEVRGPTGLARIRDRLANELLETAGTDLRRIRAAELAASLALGRRDLLPAERREGWRRSGLAHLLAVSGLHVGLVGGMVWLAAIGSRARLRTARIIVLIALPGYALLAGASASAMRAALMGMVYLAARLIGRSLIPMAAVLLVVVILVLARPELVIDAGFQLTVLITAALVRWVPRVVENIPGPRWLVGAATVPVVAQISAAPIVAWHFRTAVPGAVLANLLVPLLLAPTLVASLGATVLAPLWQTAGGWCLDAVALCEALLWLAGTPGRAVELVLPALPVLAVAVFALAGWLALQSWPKAWWGAAAWLLTGLLTASWWWLRPAPAPPRVELLPVPDGLSAIIATDRGTVLVDGGRWPDQAGRLLADRGVGRPHAVIASHTDEDHVGGLVPLMRSIGAGALILPRWMLSDPTAAPLLRAARRRGIPVLPLVRGTALELAGLRLEGLWPPALDPPRAENERSLVLRVRLPEGNVLVSSDIGIATEMRLVRRSSLDCEVLIAPHHGSRGSSSSALLAASDPAVALIPAGPGNLHNHPHSEVLARLDARAIPYRYPARDGSCGALYRDGVWSAFP
jgi:competence protein ComEC